MKRSLPKPTPGELEILRVLWARGPSTVRDVQEALGAEQTGYTTALKLMQIMADKGLLTRDETARAHVYSAQAGEGDTQRQLVRELLDRAFGGSASKLVMQALATTRATPDELREIRQLIERRSREEGRHDRD